MGSGVGISEKGWRVLGIAGEHARFPNRLETYLAIDHMSHFNVKSPLGMIFTMLLKKSSSKVTWEGVWGAILDLSSAN